MSDDDDPFRPLTAQQLGLCGPLSDDPGVGPDTPPADDQAAYLADAEGLCRSRTLPGDARGALDVLLVEYDRRGTELAAVMSALDAEGMSPSPAASFTRQAADAFASNAAALDAELSKWASRNVELGAEVVDLRARVAAVRALHAEIRVDDEGYAGCVHCGGDYPCDTLQVLDGPSGPLSPAPKDSQSLDGPAEAAEPARDEDGCENCDGVRCMDCRTRTVHDNCVDDCPTCCQPTNALWVLVSWAQESGAPRAQVNALADTLATELEIAREARASNDTTLDPAALALIDDLLRPWAYGYPIHPGYAGRAAHVSVETLAGWNARRAALASAAAPRVEPALIGTWADPEFQAHADHKHPVAGCVYCPEEEDR